MAVSDDLPGIEVAITVEGNELKEYIDPDHEEEHRTTTRYVEAESGKNFGIRMTVAKGATFIGDSMRFRINVDGNTISSKLFRVERCRVDGKTILKDRCHAGPGKSAKLEFSSLELVSDGRMHKNEDKKLKRLGDIEVIVTHRWTTEKFEENRHVYDNLGEAEMISEKALKGRSISHSVRLSTPEQDSRESGRYSGWDSVPVASSEDTSARFVFKYRSLDKLKVERIIPRTPTALPLEERDPGSLTMGELLEVARRYQELKKDPADKRRIKREGETTGTNEPKKRRKTARPFKDSTQLELDDEGNFREGSGSTFATERQVVDLD